MKSALEFERECLPCYGRVLHLCERMVGSRAQAEELAQDTYLRAFQKRLTFRGESSVSTWVLRIAYRLCLDSCKRQQRQLAWPEGEVVDEAAQRAEQARLYSLAVLSRLSERSRSVLILKAGLGLSYAEMARVLDLPANQVGVYVQRARKEALQIARAEGLL